jgi:phosphatidylinositol alpha-1,6-mannosyltransferase
VAVVSVNRLVPRKGLHLLVKAAARLAPSRPNLRVLLGGTGREADRLQSLIAETNAPVRLLGRLPDDEVPLLYGAGDVMAMLCHDRWAGLEQEGFGIVFLEAAACGIPQVAGRSGGAAEAVAHGASGLVVDDPRDLDQVVHALALLVDDPDLRHRLGRQARERAEQEFSYDHLARRLSDVLDHCDLRPGPVRARSAR